MPRPVRNILALPEQVGRAAAEEEQAAEDERVARDRPTDVGAGQLKVARETRQGDVHAVMSRMTISWAISRTNSSRRFLACGCLGCGRHGGDGCP